MGDHEEKVEEKTTIPEVSENPVKGKSEKEAEPKSEPKSEESISELEKLRRDLLAQADAQSKLQKKLNESDKVIEAFKSAFVSEENAETDVVTAETVKNQLDSLKQEIAKRDAEITKNNLIDGLDEPEPIKKYLKKYIPASTQDLEKEIEEGVKTAKELVEGLIPKTTDSRPKGVGAGSSDATNMEYVLSHPELFKK